MTWFHHIWFQYFWPSLMGNGPEALVQTVAYGLIAYLFIPPFRRWINGHFKAQKETNERQHEERLRQAEIHQAATHELLKKHYQVQVDLAKAHHAFHVAAATPVKQTQPRNAKGHFARKTS